MEFYIAQGISILTTVTAMLSMQLKNMKSILITTIIVNVLSASTYFLLNSFSGAGISLIAIIQLIVMYIYNKNGKKPHEIVVGLFIALYTIYSIFNFKNIMDIFPLIAAIFFALGIAQKKPSIFRIFGLLNPLCWLVYDIYSLALINSIMRIGIFASALISMIRLDGLFKKKQ